MVQPHRQAHRTGRRRRHEHLVQLAYHRPHDDESDGGNVRLHATGWSNHFPTDDFER